MEKVKQVSRRFRRRFNGLLALVILCLAGWGTIRWLAPSQPDVPTTLRQAIAAAKAGRQHKAIQLFDTVLAQEPRHPQALLYRGQLARERGHLDQALEYWRRVPDEPRQQAGVARYLEGTIALQRDRALDAERLFLRSIQLHPAYAQPRARLAELYGSQLRGEAMLAVLRELEKVRPLTARERAHSLLAGRPLIPPADGIALMQRFLEADANDIDSQCGLARYVLLEGRAAEATRILERLCQGHSGQEQARGLLVTALLKQHHVEQAGELLAGHLPGPQAPSSLWISFGRYCEIQHDWRQAAHSFQQVATRLPWNVEAHYAWGISLRKLGQTEDARRVLNRAVLLDRLERQAYLIARGADRAPGLVAPVMVTIGRLLTELEENTEAVAWYRHALLLRPNDPSAIAGLSRCRQLQRQVAQARASVDKSQAADVVATLPQAASSESKPRQVNPDDDSVRIRVRNVATTARLQFQYFNGNTRFKYLVETTGGGVGILDFDLDGWPDIYLPQGCPLPVDPKNITFTDRLFRNCGDGTFEEVTAAAGLRETRYSQGCAVGDFDNDGDPDLVIVNAGRNTFYRNNADGTFTDVTDRTGTGDPSTGSGAAFGDFNQDGFLDLYVVNYVADWRKICRDRQGHITTCDPVNFRGAQDRLYLNRGDGRFDDVTDQAGITVAGGKGLGVVVADLTGDGWPDIYVANDGTPNFLFVNQRQGGGVRAERRPSGSGPSLPSKPAARRVRFAEQGVLSGVALNGQGRSEAGMGIACADYNLDGTPDLFVTNFYQETNTLYLNDGTGLFRDATAEFGLAEPSRPVLGFGTQAVDLNLDGRPDLFIANGDIADYRVAGRPWKMSPQIFANRGGDRFENVSARCGDYMLGKYVGRGAARIDWNRDGRPDMVVVHQDQPVALLQNETEPAGHRVSIELRGVRGNRDAIGVRILATCGTTVRTYQLTGGGGYSAGNERRCIIGLGRATRIDALDVLWPAGRHDRWADIPADRALTLVEGRSPLLRPLH